jgi:hypothetical protein
VKIVASAFFIILIVLIFSCSHPKDNTIPPATAPVSQKAEKKLTIYLAGELNSRRTFANIQFMDDEKEIDKYVEQQEKSNPELMSPVNEILRKRFEELGIVKDNGLLLHTFSKKTKPAFQLEDESGKKITVSFKVDASVIYADEKPQITGPDSCEIKYQPFQDLRYAVLDVIPGGNKEIVLVNEWYIMNGYNFDLLVYEICMK